MLHKYARTFPSWHFSMLNDENRNSKIEAAIRSLDLKGKCVFEIGTGAGLTAMLFARYGASKVLTCETDSQLFEVAMDVFSANGLKGVIDIVNKNSKNTILDGDLDFSPDIIFTETLDCGIVGEGFVDVQNDIRSVARSDTCIIPESIDQYISIVQCDSMFNLNKVKTHCGFDLSAMNRYRTESYFPVRPALHNPKVLTAPHQIKRYSYIKDNKNQSSVVIQPLIGGICHGALSFFEASFRSFVLTNDLRSHSHWHQAFHPFEEAILVRPGTDYRLTIDMNGTTSLKEI